jgi:hypothetical protein
MEMPRAKIVAPITTDRVRMSRNVAIKFIRLTAPGCNFQVKPVKKIKSWIILPI